MGVTAGGDIERGGRRKRDRKTFILYRRAENLSKLVRDIQDHLQLAENKDNKTFLLHFFCLNLMLSCLSESSSSMLQKAAHLWSDLHILEWALHQQSNHPKLSADWLLPLFWINPLNLPQIYHLKNVFQRPSSYINFIAENLYFHIFHSPCHLSLTPTLFTPTPSPPALSFTNIHIQTQHTHISSYSLGENINFPQAFSKVIPFVLLSSCLSARCTEP